ncbi:hypothetical protein OHA69_41180 [Streptomyces anulatus]|uniref:hypothetical protein n=1 Tax=Streptomyces anulatus TaxID=1892 RepID=UPI002252C843|nr:hypothetical protein [Streptomyces anulatus]MCX4524006.1 hypothetical protein [Streptomyces anulatus]
MTEPKPESSIRCMADVVAMTPDGDNYVSEQRARIAELQARPDRLTPDDARWLLDRLAWADWHLEELRDRIDDAGSSMLTSYVSSAIDYARWSRGTPRGPVIANACSSGPPPAFDDPDHAADHLAETPSSALAEQRAQLSPVAPASCDSQR